MVREGASRNRSAVLATDASERRGARCLDGFTDARAGGGKSEGIALANTAEMATPGMTVRVEQLVMSIGCAGRVAAN